ncbi:hypothetical protein BGW38_004821 [Lunasporangiospora selenospora]|uniref:Adhesin domain-containing protein n=1 Tax=Lunasporangiospora selenospora TaxID=979761 RepID=A0A9P6G0P8_9FUNG|nr:hypothetical protein BGW38_004821 [Lunasporangiospora selenospora]
MHGEITILSGNEDMIHIRTSVQAKESIIRNAAALEPVQDGNQYTYTIHTPLEEMLGKAVTFQMFITIPRMLDSLESFSITGANVELSVGNISHTFIRSLKVVNGRGDITFENFYGETASIQSTSLGAISGRYNVARFFTTSKLGRAECNVRLLNAEVSNRVVVSTTNSKIRLSVDGSDLLQSFTVEAKTQCAPLEAKVLLGSKDQRLVGNFINFGGPLRISLSGNYQGRVETRTHYGKIFLEEPEFVRLEGAVMTVPSTSGRQRRGLHHPPPPHGLSTSSSSSIIPLPPTPTSPTTFGTNGQNGSSSHVQISPARTHLAERSSSSNVSHQSLQDTAMTWGEDDHLHHHQPPSPSYSHPPNHYTHFTLQSPGVSSSSSSSSTSSRRAGSMHESELGSTGRTSGGEEGRRPRSESVSVSYSGSGNGGGGGGSSGHGSNSGSLPLSQSVPSQHSSLYGPATSGRVGSKVAKMAAEKQRRKDDEKDSVVTREVIGMIGEGAGLIMAKNSSGDITFQLI